MPHHQPCLIVIHRGESEVFERLQAELAATSGARVIRDRRERDRRVIIQDVEVERRRGERRAPLHATLWTTCGYILARPHAGEADSAPKRRRGSGLDN